MEKLTFREYDAVIAAIEGKPRDKRFLANGIKKMQIGSGIRPDFAEGYPSFPSSASDLLRDAEWSKQHVDNHQAACTAAWVEYWRVMTNK